MFIDGSEMLQYNVLPMYIIHKCPCNNTCNTKTKPTLPRCKYLDMLTHRFVY